MSDAGRLRLINSAYMAAGVLLSGYALKSFILANGFLDGGTTGLSLVIHAFAPIDVAWLVLPLNLPFILLGARLIDRAFAVKTSSCVLALSLALWLVPYPLATHDRLLASIFGGVFMGAGVGLAMRGGAALDGLDVLALYTGRRLPFTTSEIIIAINALIFLVAAIGLGVEAALYSMLTFYAGSRTSDFIVDGLEEYTSVTIVSSESEAIKHALVNRLGRGITVYHGERGFLPGSFHVAGSVDIISTVVTRLEIRRLSQAVHAIDPKAFMVTATVNEAVGGVVKRHASY